MKHTFNTYTHVLLGVLLCLSLPACSGGGGDAPPSVIEPPGPTDPTPDPKPDPKPGQASLIYSVGDACCDPPRQLVRVQTDGSGRVTLADAVGLDIYKPHVFVSGLTVVYHILSDIWAGTTDGANKALIIPNGLVLDVVGPWMIYRTNGTIRTFNGTVDNLITNEPVQYLFDVNPRLVFLRDADKMLFSTALDGTDRRDHGPLGNTLAVTNVHGALTSSCGDQLITSLEDPANGHQFAIFAIPIGRLPCGQVIQIVSENGDYIRVEALAGDRLIYQRCPNLAQGGTGQCDLYSVKSDGTGTAALGATPRGEAFQGISGDRVIIRRDQGGTTDSLYGIPIAGGAETPILTLDFMTEFVTDFIGDRILFVRRVNDEDIFRPMLSVRRDGSGLVQLTESWYTLAMSGGSTGRFACFEHGPGDLSCVPVDGSAPAKKVTGGSGGAFVVGL